MRRLILVSCFVAAIFAGQLSFNSLTSLSSQTKHSNFSVTEWEEYVYIGDILYKITYHDDGSITIIQASQSTQD